MRVFLLPLVIFTLSSAASGAAKELDLKIKKSASVQDDGDKTDSAPKSDAKTLELPDFTRLTPRSDKGQPLRVKSPCPMNSASFGSRVEDQPHYNRRAGYQPHDPTSGASPECDRFERSWKLGQ